MRFEEPSLMALYPLIKLFIESPDSGAITDYSFLSPSTSQSYRASNYKTRYARYKESPVTEPENLTEDVEIYRKAWPIK